MSSKIFTEMAKRYSNAKGVAMKVMLKNGSIHGVDGFKVKGKYLSKGETNIALSDINYIELESIE